jgi:GNAT superfamily N-acetyltransferase
MNMPNLERIAAFEERFVRAQSTDIVGLPWGFALLNSTYPLSEYHNRLVVTSIAPPADVVRAADELLGGAGLRHRYVSGVDRLGEALSAGLIAAGYEHQVIETMIYEGGEVEPGAHRVHDVSLDILRPSIVRNWRAEIPDASDELLGQLADRTSLAALGAELTLLAVFEGDEIAAHAELYIDRSDHIAQIENLVTHECYRGQGYGISLVRDALRRAEAAGCELRFLTADLDDWPRQWYQRLGFVDALDTHHFSSRQS